MKIFRLWGLLTFIVLSSVFVGFWYFLAAPLTKSAIEHFGTQAAKAEVNVETVDFTLEPLSFDVRGIQVTDSSNPANNLVQIDQATARVHLWKLLAGKTYVELLAVNGIKLDTPRSQPGKVYLEEKKAEKKDSADTQGSTGNSNSSSKEKSNNKVPNVDDLLAKEPLETDAAAKDLQNYYTDSQKQLDESLKNIPDGSQITQYQTDIKGLSNVNDIKSLDDFKKKQDAFNRIKSSIQNDQRAITDATYLINEPRKELTNRIDRLRKAPAKDLENLKSKYKIDAEGAGNISRLLFGDQAGEWAEQAAIWYEKIKPYLPQDSGKEGDDASQPEVVRTEAGRWIHYPGRAPTPKFSIAKLSGDVLMGEREFKLESKDITTEQVLIGRTTQFTLFNRYKQESVDLKGEVDLMTSTAKVPFNLEAQNIQVNKRELVDSAQIKLALNQANLNIEGKGELTQGNVAATFVNRFDQSQFKGEGKNTASKELVLALGNIKEFDATVEVKGKPLAPAIDVRSNLDKKVSSAFHQRFQQQKAKFESELKQKLENKKQALIKPYEEKVAALDNQKKSLLNKANDLKSSANSKLTDWKTIQKKRADEAKKKKEKELKDKAKKELTDKLKDFKL